MLLLFLVLLDAGALHLLLLVWLALVVRLINLL